jgi:hypothetical protein
MVALTMLTFILPSADPVTKSLQLDQQQWLSLQNHGSERAASVVAVQGQIHM